MKRIVILDLGYRSYQVERTLFAAQEYELALFSSPNEDIRAKIAFAQDAEGVLVRGTLLSESVLRQMPSVRAIVRYGVGYENIDLEAATRLGIRVANVQGYADHSVSDHALALILACARGLQPGLKQFPHRFGAPPFADVIELYDKTLGIIGLGRIGGCLSRKASRLFARVVAVDPFKPDEWFQATGAERVALADLLEISHVISLHCSQTPETIRLVNASTLALMKQRPIVINTARGPIIDEPALVDAFKTNRLHSLGLDVYADEPPSAAQRRLMQHPRVLTTGHYDWYSDHASEELQRRAAQNMIGLLRGEAVDDCLNLV